MSTDGELWHIVEAKRDDGTPTMFRIRELDPQKHLDRIFVVELPYPATEMSRLPSAASWRRLADFDEQWLRPTCQGLGWELVASKTEDGSSFLYVYGTGGLDDLVPKLSPFDVNLGFYDDDDPDWLEYATLRELLDQAKAIKPAGDAEPAKAKPAPKKKPAPKAKPKAKIAPKPKAKPSPKKPAPKKKPSPKPKAKAKPKRR